ncbi:hypothetical protein H4R18_002121 [Coemansia javaensis]|uniref:PSP1 C-terminal domain-containing protein n=1 Tax=Coemansia javaensis TaxID=2761396 RepID=A0A9W8HD40_9FUNG|nr:hypothetical protein H4R18_002121 [Coemansia javaensis]
MRADPVLADACKYSATLDSIGAWTPVQPAAAAAAAQAIDVIQEHSLDAKYGRMALAQSPLAESVNGSSSSGFGGFGSYNLGSGGGGSGGGGSSFHPMDRRGAPGDEPRDVDYSELDEAILRGRSTTLPNIFTAPGSLFRLSAGPGPDAGPPMPISPASTATLDMLSRHGSISVASHPGRTVSPLGLSLSAIPVYQTASLDNPLASPPGRLDALSRAGGTAAMSASVSSTGSLSGPGGAPVRRLSEYAEPPPLPLGSYSMLDAINTTCGAAAFPPAAVTAAPPSATAAWYNGGGGGALVAHQLATMREEDAPAGALLACGAASPHADPAVDAGGALPRPVRVQSLKDVQRAPGDQPPGDGGPLHHSLSLSHLAGVSGMYRRHSLAGANAQIAAAPLPGEGLAHPPQMHPGAAAALYPPPMCPPFGGPAAIPRQNSMSALPPFFGPQSYHHHHHPLYPAPPGHFPGPAPFPYPAQLGGRIHAPPPPPPPPAAPAAAPPALRAIQPVPAARQPQSKQQPHAHARRASHPGIPGPPGPHQPPPNPATTITPNMPFADMGKGLAYQSLPKGARVFVVQFKGARCDLFFAPKKGMDARVVPTLVPAKDPRPAPSAMPAPAAAAAAAKPKYSAGMYVLVEADRGVDLGVIKEELMTAESVVAFDRALLEAAASGAACADSKRSSKDIAGKDDKDCGAGDDAPGSAAKDVYVKRIFRPADRLEMADLQGNKIRDEQNALSICQGKVQQRKLAMRVVDAEFQFDRRKLTFYFTAERRVDFRELVRDLFKHFKTRIWMCQKTAS